MMTVSEKQQGNKPRVYFQQNVLMIFHGLYDTPFKCLVAVYDSAIVQRLYDCDGAFLPEPHSEAETWLRDEILKLSETRPDDVGRRLREAFGVPNVFVIPPRGFIAGKMIERGISAIVSVDCDELD